MQNKGSLQHKFDNFGANASPSVWNSIASTLDVNKRKKALVIWWTTTGIAACLLTIFGLQFMTPYTTKNLIKNKQPQQQKQNVIIAPTNKIIDTTNLTQIKNNHHQSMIENNNKTENKSKNKEQLLKPKPKSTKNTRVNQPHLSKKENLEQSVKNKNLALNESKDILKLKRKFDVDLTQNQINSELALQIIDYTPKQESKWEFGTKIQSQIGFSNAEQYASETNNTINAFDAPSNAFVQSTPLNIKTNRPLTLRFELKRNNKKRINFKTGIDAGWVFTQAIESSNDYKKSIITIGIPLKLDLKILSKKRFALHSDFGLVNDIPILEFGKYGLYNESTTQNTKFISGFMGGLEMGLNAQYALNENIKISAGTGIKWYYLQRIKNASPLIEQRTFGLFNFGLIWRY